MFETKNDLKNIQFKKNDQNYVKCITVLARKMGDVFGAFEGGGNAKIILKIICNVD